MRKFAIVGVENIEDLAITIEETLSENKVKYVDKYVDLSVLMNISRLHELVFQGKIWGVVELDEKCAVLDYFLIELPGEMFPDLTYGTALIWCNAEKELFDYMVDALSKEYKNVIKKVKFRVVSECNFDDYEKNIFNILKKETEIIAGNRTMRTYIYNL